MDFTETSWADSRMDFRRRKLYLTLGITGIGMLIAVIWHGWQGWGLGRSYPYNTFLLAPSLRFSDFTGPVIASRLPSPYLDQFSDYFPFTYWLLKYLVFTSPLTAAYLFLCLTSLGLGAVLLVALRPVIFSVTERLVCAAGLLAFSYPFLFCLDRANLEMILALLVSIALLYFRNRRWVPGLAWLFPAICMKFYPILLLALFVRPRHLVKIVIVGMAFLILSLCCMATFDHTLEENFGLWHRNLQTFKECYIIRNWGFAGSASAWNTGRGLLVSGYCLINPAFNADKAYPPLDLIYLAYDVYALLALGSALAVTSYTILIEREFFRRVILLLLLAAMAAPSGGDYKLLFANVALIVLILLPRQRPHDLLATGLLAFVMVPKKEIFLTYLGITDSWFHDISIAILLNPPCMLIAMGLLIRDGFQPGTWRHLQQRFFGIINPIRHYLVATSLERPPTRTKSSRRS